MEWEEESRGQSSSRRRRGGCSSREKEGGAEEGVGGAAGGVRNPAGLTGENPHAPLRVTAGPARSHARPFHSSPHPSPPTSLYLVPHPSAPLPLLSFAFLFPSSAPTLAQASRPILLSCLHHSLPHLFSYHVRLIPSTLPLFQTPPNNHTLYMQPSLLPASPYFSLPFSPSHPAPQTFPAVISTTYLTDPPPFTFSDSPSTFSTSTPNHTPYPGLHSSLTLSRPTTFSILHPPTNHQPFPFPLIRPTVSFSSRHLRPPHFTSPPYLLLCSLHLIIRLSSPCLIYSSTPFCLSS